MSRDQAHKLLARLQSEAEAAGYLINPDQELVLDLMDGLRTNQERFGYQACPCRLPEGERALDRDIICPCDYRDPDLDEHGACFCALYVSSEVHSGSRPVKPVPERRHDPKDPAPGPSAQPAKAVLAGSQPVWRCQVCGYLCARPQPPLKCPICKADKDRFEQFA